MIMQSGAIYILSCFVMLNVVMLSVVMMSVVAPFVTGNREDTYAKYVNFS
jgi:hypothetical protein